MATEKRLGRGLGSLLPPKHDVGSSPEMVAVDSIDPNRFQPRQHFDESSLSELRESIRIHGVLQPIALRRNGERYELIAGERRWRAAKGAGLRSIPAVIRDEASDAQMLELALVENVQREDLDPIERALGFKRMVDELAMTQSTVAERVGLKRATVTNHIRLLDLAEPIQRLVARGAISMGHARALLGLAEPADRAQLADLIVHQGLSVREVESRVRRANGVDEDALEEVEVKPTPKPSGHDTPAAAEAEAPPWASALEKRLRSALATKVRLKLQEGDRGQIVIEFAGHAELDRLVSAIAPKAEL